MGPSISVCQPEWMHGQHLHWRGINKTIFD
uniref:Uncharacterized protein n=1 Tax=Anguilla anguilla TaxID=7936 RepID=A0A0E9SGM3_ANGAN